MTGRVVWDGTYELCGTHIQGNPENCTFEMLIPHGVCVIAEIEKLSAITYEGMKAYLQGLKESGKAIEGIVWWYNGEPVGKIKTKDF